MNKELKRELRNFVIRVLKGENTTLQETAILPEMTKILMELSDADTSDKD